MFPKKMSGTAGKKPPFAVQSNSISDWEELAFIYLFHNGPTFSSSSAEDQNGMNVNKKNKNKNTYSLP